MAQMADSAENKEKKAKQEKKEKKAKKSAVSVFWAGVKAEFKKIIWPDRQSTFKQSVAVVAISVVVGVIIAILDYVAKNGVNFITSI